MASVSYRGGVDFDEEDSGDVRGGGVVFDAFARAGLIPALVNAIRDLNAAANEERGVGPGRGKGAGKTESPSEIEWSWPAASSLCHLRSNSFAEGMGSDDTDSPPSPPALGEVLGDRAFYFVTCFPGCSI